MSKLDTVIDVADTLAIAGKMLRRAKVLLVMVDADSLHLVKQDIGRWLQDFDDEFGAPGIQRDGDNEAK